MYVYTNQRRLLFFFYSGCFSNRCFSKTEWWLWSRRCFANRLPLFQHSPKLNTSRMKSPPMTLSSMLFTLLDFNMLLFLMLLLCSSFVYMLFVYFLCYRHTHIHIYCVSRMQLNPITADSSISRTERSLCLILSLISLYVCLSMAVGSF